MCLRLAIERPRDVLSRGEHAGHQWMTVHNGLGHRCGYVRVNKGHPWFGKNLHNAPAECHGGVTFAEADVPCDKGGADDGWWLGFDCMHCDDLPDPSLPGSGKVPNNWAGREFDRDDGAIIRTQEYVEDECRSVCEQAAAQQALNEEFGG